MPSKKTLTLLIAIVVVISGILSNAATAFAATGEKTIFSFCSPTQCDDGLGPVASLISDSAGNLYGTATRGGVDNCVTVGCGTVFELIRGKSGIWTNKVLHSFVGGDDGYYPTGNLVLDANGNLYGTTRYGGFDGVCSDGDFAGCGIVFQLIRGKKGQWKEKILHIFGKSRTVADGFYPYSSLVLDASGNLYGTTSSGGASGYGTVFELLRDASGGWGYKILRNFNGSDGSSPVSSLIFDSSGRLYGTATDGGADKAGVVFELIPGENGKWTEKVLHSFDDEGACPTGGLIFDAAGKLYGTSGGAVLGTCFSMGDAFRLTRGEKGNWSEMVLFEFSNWGEGAFPSSSLIFDASGSLYGATPNGGELQACPDGCGVVFKLTPGADGSWTEKVLHSFTNSGGDGAHPWGPLIFDAAGNLYGTTQLGGAYGDGAVFEITP
jgi:uncharacterized repeat protein (TIGR03803 family)